MIYTTINEILSDIYNTNYAPLYHGLKYKYAHKAISTNKLNCHTTQRFWDDGRRRRDDESDYYDSKWYVNFFIQK